MDSITVQPQFIPIFKIDSKYLIINGNMRSGKFYAACQKVVAECYKKSGTVAVVVCNYPKYAMQIITEIDATLEYNLTYKLYSLVNGSKIRIVTESQINNILRFDFVVLKGADCMKIETFKSVDKYFVKQIILTCNPPSHNHWLRKLNNCLCCERIDVGIIDKSIIKLCAKPYL